MQTLFNTTMTEYKGLLHLWHKGTGGGPGLDMYFESWSEDKRNKYDVDLETYDHSIISKRPAICIENYNQDVIKKPYLTIIHMWDEMSINLLSSKHDPFEKQTGEIGMESSSEDEVTSTVASSSTASSSRKTKSDIKDATPNSNSKRRKKKKHRKLTLSEGEEDDIGGAIKAVLQMNSSDTLVKKKSPVTRLEDMTHEDLFAQIELHQSHLKFLQDNDMCTSAEKAEIVGRVKEIYKVITTSHNVNKNVS